MFNEIETFSFPFVCEKSIFGFQFIPYLFYIMCPRGPQLNII